MTEQVEKVNNGGTDMLQKMLDAGVHFGHKTAKGHPKMKPYVLATRQNVQIINVEKTLAKLEEAAAFLKDVASSGGVILLVGTKVPGKLLIESAAKDINMPYVSERWLGGTFTNFPVLSKRLEYFLSQEAKKKQGELDKYSKKEQAVLNRELESFERKLGGIKTLKKLPNAMLVIDIGDHKAGVLEAIKMKVPVVAISDTNTDPTMATYPIPANDKSISSLSFILNHLVAAIKEGQVKASTTTPSN